MRRVLAVTVLACGLAAVTPAAEAARPCGPGIDVNCSTGAGACLVWVGQLHDCVL